MLTSQSLEKSLADKLEKKERARLKKDWAKATARLEDDAEGALTAARALLESTCKHVLEVLDVAYSDDADLPKLYSAATASLGMRAAGHINRLQKQFFGAIHTIVQAVGELRNKAGDAHGKGNQSVSASKAQSELAVHLAGAVANYLLNSLESHLSATRRLTSNGEAVLKFDIATVWRLVDHAATAPRHMKTWGERKEKPALWLVGDAGVYLMSNGKPPMLYDGRISRSKSSKDTPRLTSHAEGCDATDEIDDWWPIHNAIAGGDDFVEAIPLRVIRRALKSAKSHIVIVADQTNYAVYSDAEFAALNSPQPGTATPTP